LQRAQCLIALNQIWSQSAFNSGDATPARQKLHWWYEEISRNRQSHPLTQAQPDIAADEHRKLLLSVLATYVELIDQGSPADYERNRQFHRNTGGALARLISSDYTTTEPASEAVGIALSRWRCLRYCGLHLRAGLLCLPQSQLRSAGIEPAQLIKTPPEPSVVDWLVAQAAELQTELQSAILTLYTNPRHQQRSLFVYASLQAKLLSVQAKNPQELIGTITRLTPMHYLWHAWLAARRHGKSSKRRAR